MWLALALHDALGWQICAQIETPGTPQEYIAHAYVRSPTGVEVDILGLQPDGVDQFAPTVRCFSRRGFVRYIVRTSGRSFSSAEARRHLEEARKVLYRYIQL
jgi:hypothetical protein